MFQWVEGVRLGEAAEVQVADEVLAAEAEAAALADAAAQAAITAAARAVSTAADPGIHLAGSDLPRIGIPAAWALPFLDMRWGEGAAGEDAGHFFTGVVLAALPYSLRLSWQWFSSLPYQAKATIIIQTLSGR